MSFLSCTAFRTSAWISLYSAAGALMLNFLRPLRKAELSRDSSHHVLDDSAPLVTPEPPTLPRSIKSTLFRKSRARIAAAYPDGPAPITTRSNLLISNYLQRYYYFGVKG